MPHQQNRLNADLEVFHDCVKLYESAKDMLANGQAEEGVKILCRLHDLLRKQAHVEDTILEFRVRLLQMQIVVDLKSLTFGMSGFDGWDV